MFLHFRSVPEFFFIFVEKVYLPCASRTEMLRALIRFCAHTHTKRKKIKKWKDVPFTAHQLLDLRIFPVHLRKLSYYLVYCKTNWWHVMDLLFPEASCRPPIMFNDAGITDSVLLFCCSSFIMAILILFRVLSWFSSCMCVCVRVCVSHKDMKPRIRHTTATTWLLTPTYTSRTLCTMIWKD